MDGPMETIDGVETGNTVAPNYVRAVAEQQGAIDKDELLAAMNAASNQILDSYRTWVADDTEAKPRYGQIPRYDELNNAITRLEVFGLASPSQVAPANPAQVTDAMVRRFIDVSRSEDAGYTCWTDAVRAALTAAIGAEGQAVQDTWFTDRALPVKAMSGDVEDNRVLRLHFRRPVTDDDCKAMCDALNLHQASLANPAPSGQAVADEPVSFQWRNVDGWVEANIGGTIGQRRDYAKQMAVNCGLGYRELYAHPQPIPLKDEVERVVEPFAEEATEWADDVPDGYHPGVTEPGHDQAHASAKFSLGHLRAARALLSRLRAGEQEGWRTECATEGCNKAATVHFERGGIGSYYCHDCYLRIQALPASPPVSEGVRNG